MVGKNGSGKSTLMKILVGALEPDAGTVTHAGNMGYCPQSPVVYERLTCDEQFELFGMAYGMSPDAQRRSRGELAAISGRRTRHVERWHAPCPGGHRAGLGCQHLRTS